MKMSNKYRFENSILEPTNFTNSISATITDRKAIKTKILNNSPQTRNTNTSYQVSKSFTIHSKKNQKRIELLKKELFLNTVKPIHIEKMITEDEIKYNKYNFPKLGPFIRKGNNIPYTHILSPFSLQSRDEFFYKKIFFNYINQQKKKLQEKFKPLDNKLNIDYAETIEQYEERLEKRNSILLKKGKKIKHQAKENHSEQQLKRMQHISGFMKCVCDYAYPDMILYRAKVFEETLKKKFWKLPPFLQKDKDIKDKEILLQSYLNEAIQIK